MRGDADARDAKRYADTGKNERCTVHHDSDSDARVRVDSDARVRVDSDARVRFDSDARYGLTRMRGYGLTRMRGTAPPYGLTLYGFIRRQGPLIRGPLFAAP